MPPLPKNSNKTKEKEAPAPPEPPRGRPSLLTPSLAKRICELIRLGNYIEVAAASVGIHRHTLFRWLKEGGKIRQQMEADASYEPRGHDKDLLDFSVAVEKAQADSEIVATSVLATSKDWRAHAWRLGRRFSARWGTSDETVEAGDDGPPEGDEVDDVEALARVLDAMAEKRSKRAAAPSKEKAEKPKKARDGE